MSYKFMYYSSQRGVKIITLMDFKNARLMNFDLEYLQSEEAPDELKAYMRKIWKSRVENSMWEYKGKTPR
ncbi:hypothetical protein AWH56_010745 [Anaerobacillus isosaccharinicus]|uniref:Uncharacterized protein n=1 Tax=Anaerobacillus isosaccharinicus TaxID=1532552 RepID=A0A1S2MD39_9BACI|nr:hypothetical protein [Anaerobacillus isosaccharinicus]MBA5588593.1 hypothetical protein [Anaerobacillus isosaccharinicus]QOY37994.1 hypothetical protein AWH56_010745 [Anaerobacillus isosaccharinicus]